MTGYGKAEAELEGKNMSISVKSVNSKTLDLNLRMPFQFREKENEIRKLLQKNLVRGKVDFGIMLEVGNNQNAHKINKAVFAEYLEQLKGATQNLEVSDDAMLSSISRLPNLLSQEKEEFDSHTWIVCLEAIESAINELVDFRKKEGATLEEDLKSRIDIIFKLREQIELLEGERMEIVKNRLHKQVEESGQKDKLNQDRFEQELIYFLEKLDITEEQVRLKSHADLFIETLNNESFQGRKLGFISQEIGREINTIGSKANHAGIQKLVVGMKDELEKIKEQLFNIL